MSVRHRRAGIAGDESSPITKHHSNNNHHICWFCQRQFQKKEHLLRHERVHSGERPFACKRCGKTYARRDTLQRHERLHESGQDGGDEVKGEDSESIVSQPTPSSAVPQNTSATNAIPTPPTDPIVQHQHQHHKQQHQQQQQHQPNIQPTIFPSTIPGVPNTPSYGCAVDGLTSNPLLPNWFNSTDFQIPQDFNLDPFNLTFDSIAPWALQDDPAAPAFPPQPSTTAIDAVVRPQTGPDCLTQWFSYFESPLHANQAPSHRHASTGKNGHDVDENYRIVVQTQLNNHPPIDTVPSTAFLNRCIRLYIEKFSRLMPIVHLPTFRPTERNAWLVVAMCSVGSQLVGTTEAIAHGERMFDSVQRTVLASWQSLLTGTFDSLSVLQGVIIGQTYAMLSAKSSHLLTAQAFHGTIVFCYRKVIATLKRWVQTAIHSNQTMPDQQQAKNVDMIREIVVRIGCVLRIVDVELALLCHQIPIMITPDGDHAPDYSDQEFCVQAPETKSQGSSWPQDPTRPPSMGYGAGSKAASLPRPSLWDYAQLADGLSEAIEQRRRSASKHPLDLGTLGNHLTSWYRQASDRFQLSGGLHLDCLWHSGWLAILCDIDQLEIALGREGAVGAEEVQDDMRKWAASEAARHALLHAYLIQKSLAAVTVSEWPAIHVPRCAYQAGLIFCGFARFAPQGQNIFANGATREALERFVEVRMLMDVGTLTAYDWWTLDHEYDVPSKMPEHAHSMSSLLRRIGPWGLSLNLARTLEAVLGERY